MKKINIQIIHAYSDSNKGDLAIVAGMVTGIRRIHPDAVISLQSVFDSSDPDFESHHRFVRDMGLTVLSMPIPSPYIDDRSHGLVRNIRAAVKLFADFIKEFLILHVPGARSISSSQSASLDSTRAADIILLKGGQYIYNDQGGIRALLYLWRILHPIYVAARLGKPVALMGQSIGPLVNETGRRMTASALSLMQTILVRERKSLALMDELGLSEKTRLSPDFAFLVEPIENTDPNTSFYTMDRGNCFGVTVVNWYFPGEPDPKSARDRYVNELTESCKNIYLKYKLEVILIPQVTVKHHGESDMDLLCFISTQLHTANIPHRIISEDLSPSQLAGVYGRCRFLIGTRLHSCILAACAGTPILAIRYQGFKTEGVMAELDQSELVLDISSVTERLIFDAVTSILSERETISTRLLSKVVEFRGKLLDDLDRVLDFRK